MTQQTAVYSTKSNKNFTIIPENVIIDFIGSKLSFNKQQITLGELLNVYAKLKSYLNTFNGVNL